MRIAIIMLAIGGLVCTTDTLANETGQKDDKKPAVRSIDLKGLRREQPRGDVKKPAVITSAEELAKAFPEEDLRARIKKEVDLETEKLLFFAWSGSGGDKLEPKVIEGKEAPEVLFVYRAGFTDDLRYHFQLFAIPRKATWRVGDK